MEKMVGLEHDWDKTFPRSEKMSHSEVKFRNRYGIVLAADLYEPKNRSGKLPAIAVAAGLLTLSPRTRLSF